MSPASFPGRYSAREGVPLSLTSEDSGSAESWTTFRAADATAPPVLSAGVAVPAQLFRPWARNPRVLVANVSGLVDDLGRFGASPAGACAHDHAELYFGGEPQTSARWPNKFAAGSAAFAGTPLRQWARTAAGAGTTRARSRPRASASRSLRGPVMLRVT